MSIGGEGQSTGRAAASDRTGTKARKRVIAVCADDFGLHAGVNHAALELAAAKRISAISCLVDGPAWVAGARALADGACSAELGLHLNLTEPFGQSFRTLPLRRLIARAYGGRLDRAHLRQEVLRQLQRFSDATGRPPDFVDGHQHVHQLPSIRDVLIELVNERYTSTRPWVRIALPPARCARGGLPLSATLKSHLIGRLGARALRALARRHGYPHTGHLLGVYGFAPSEAGYLLRMSGWLRCAQDDDVLMCHPSVQHAGNDPLREVRYQEYRVLASTVFLNLLQSSEIDIGPLGGRSPSPRPA